MLEHLNLDPERDKIAILAVGDQNILSQALEAGTIDATVLDGVQGRRLAALGFPTLVDLNKYNLPIIEFGLSCGSPIFRRTPSWRKTCFKRGHRRRCVFAVGPAKA